MTYDEVLQWMYAHTPMFHYIGAAAYKPGLDNTLSLMTMIGHPHRRLRCIHIAGTNGKGSVSHMLASILQEAGYKTGLFTSPHLFDFRERIRIQGQLIPEDYVIRFVQTYRSKIEQIQPSFFEITFALAMKWFDDARVDVVVLETGMGGRLDATNVVRPVLSVITNISYDHMQFLGNTLEQIAQEKAGIIKSGIPVVIGRSQSEVQHVFKAKAKLEHSPIYFADKKFHFLRTALKFTRLEGYVSKKNKIYLKTLMVPLPGLYQQENIITVVQAAHLLKKLGFKIRKKHIRYGILKIKENTGLMGRWDIIRLHPAVICDVAHNAEGLQKDFQQLQQFEYDTLRVILGFSDDKDVVKITSFLPSTAQYYITQAQLPRAMPTDKLAFYMNEKGLAHKVYRTVNEAYEAALSEALASDLIFIAGSIYIVAELKALQEKYQKTDHL